MDTATRNGGRGGHAGSIELYGHVRPAVWQAVWIIFENMLGPVGVWPQARWPATCTSVASGPLACNLYECGLRLAGLQPVQVWPQARWPATCPAPSEGVSQPRVLVQVVVHGYHHK